ncbi:MAG: leucine--tRNA ligase, partial [Candidatus Bathyarchaeia archaeon]
HICEELWEIMGGKGFVSLSPWPKPDETKVDVRTEEMEAFISSLLEDTLNIVKATGIVPKKVFYYTAAPWKWQVYMKALEIAATEKLTQNTLIKKLFEDPDLKAKAKEIAEFAAKIVDEINRMPVEKRRKLLNIRAGDEERALTDAKEFIGREINAEIRIYSEEDSGRYDPKNRAHLAKPMRPAIYIE